MSKKLENHPGIVSMPRRVVPVAALILILSLMIGLPAFAQDDPAFVGQVRSIESDELGIINPAGLAFSPVTNAFHVVEVGQPVRLPAPFSDIVAIRPAGDRAGLVRTWTTTADPINMAYDVEANRMLLYQSASQQLIEMAAGPDGHLDPAMLTRHDARRFALRSPQGITVNPANGDVFILDSAGPRIVRIEPTPDGGFGDAEITADLAHTNLSDLRGLALDPANGHLYVLNRAEQTLYELTQSGQVVAIRDISAFQLSDPQGMVFAPSGDLTDDPSSMNLFIADSGLGVEQPRQTTAPAAGRIIELTFVQPVALAPTAFSASLVQTIDTSLFLPPSPDPAGIAYVDSSNTLMVSDSEVNRTPIFTGDNLFRVRLSGDLFDTLTTMHFSNEPTGVGYNPDNRHLFFTDDNRLKVYEIDPGSDGLYDTPDDVITSFDTDGFGSTDPEGVTYARGLGDLFIADGLNREVYRVAPGGDGVFGTSDDQVTNFDTAGYGVTDPEGIAFNHDNGHLYLVGDSSSTIAEMTTGGDFVQMIDISAADAYRPAGLAYGPSSQDPDVMHIYISDWGVDNSADPDENDGKLYEMTLPPDPGSLAIVKEVEPASAGPGEVIAYTLSFSNDGDDTATGVTITDTIPVSVTVQSVTNSGADITDTGASPPYVWEVEDLASGEGGVINITAELSSTLPCGHVFGNTASIAATSGDSDPDDNSSSVSVAVGRGVVVTPEDASDSGNSGTDVVYDLLVTNTGDCADTFDVAISGNVWPVSAPTTVESLASGADTNVEVTVHIPSDARCGADFATVTFTSQGGGTVFDSSILTTTANTVYSVAVEPPSNAAFGNPGAVLTHTLWVTNTGNCVDTFDLVLTGEVWPTVAPDTVGPLGPGMGAAVDITATVPVDAECDDADTAAVTLTSQGNGTVTGSSNLTSTANPVYGVSVEPPSDARSGDPGTDLVYPLRVTNLGNCADTFDSAIGSALWPTDAPAAVGPLAPGAWSDLDVTVTVPPDAACGDDVATVSFTSQGDALVSGSSILTSTANANYGVTVDPPSNAAWGDPGTDVVHTLWVTNTGNCPDTYDLKVRRDQWATEAPSAVGSLAAGMGARVDVTMTVPLDAACEDSDNFSVILTSQADGTVSDSSELTTSANAVGEVVVAPSSDAAWDDPGADVVHTLWVTNTGNCADTFDLALTGDEWTTEAPSTVGPLAADQVTSVAVTVTVPEEAACEDFDGATVTLTSQADVTASDSSEITTTANAVYGVTVLPPSDADSGAQGDEVIYNLWVVNSGNCSDTFDRAVSGNQWTTEAPATAGPLGPGAIASVNVTVTVAADAQCGDDVATVTYTSQGDGTASDSSILTTSANAVYGVTVDPPSDAAIRDPGTDVVYSLQVTNTGNCADTFDLTLADDEWTTEAPTTVGPLFGGVGASVDVTVTVPLDAGCGDEDGATVTLTSQADLTASDWSGLTTSASTVRGVAVEPSSDADTGDPGTDVVYTLQVTNTGNCVDTFDLATSGNAWTTDAVSTVGPLVAGSGASVDVTVSVPACTAGGSSDAPAVVFSSQNDGTAWDSASLTTTANHATPVSVDDTYFLPEDTQRTVGAPGVLGNDHDANCDPLSATLMVTPANGAVAFKADGSFTYTPTANFDGDDNFTYSASDGALSSTATVTLTVISAGDDPIVDAGEPKTADEGEIVSFTGSFIDPARRILTPDSSIHWDFGDGDTATGTLTPTHQYLDSGLFTVTLTVTDTSGDAGQDSVLVTVHNVAPTVDAGPDLLAVPGIPFSISGGFTDPGLDDTHSIEWDLDDGTIVSDTLAFDHTYEAVGVYTVTLTVIDDDDGVGSDTAVIITAYRVYLPLVFKATPP